MISIVLNIFFAAVICYAAYRIWYLAGKLADAQEYIDQLELTNEYMYGKIIDSYEAMQEIDRLGAFEKDDEAGTTFQMLNQTITELKEQFDGEAQEEK
jgi:hypothetical protein